MTYKETQRFKQIWIWLLLIAVAATTIGIVGYGCYQQLYLGIQFGDNPTGDAALLFTFILIVFFNAAIIAMFAFAKLTTLIDEQGIHYRFFPFHFKMRTIAWDQIDHYEVIQYKPLIDYGGWGIRYGRGKKAYNIRGNKGLQIYMKTGKNLLIGTQKEKELEEFLRMMRR